MTPEDVAQAAVEDVIRSHKSFHGGSVPGMLYGTARCIFEGALLRLAHELMGKVETPLGGWQSWAKENEGSYVEQITAAFPLEKKRRRVSRG